MAQTYFAILTAVGEAKIANAHALGTTVDITQMAVGDGNGAPTVPDTAQTALVNENRRAPLNTLMVDPLNPNQIIAEQVIPENVGGWWIRELGLFDADGDLIAIANCPDTYKPQLAEGSGRTQVIRMVLIVSSTAAVQLKIDPSVVLATRSYVDGQILTVMSNIASQAEAEGGTNNTKFMTPSRVAQAMHAQRPLPLFGHMIDGLTLSNSETDAANDIDVAPGICLDEARSAVLQLQTPITKRLDAAWTAGSGNGGLDTGTKAADTWYDVFLIVREADGLVDALFAKADASPVMPSGYTSKRRLGSVRTNGSGNIIGFSQNGNEFLWNSSITDVNVTNLGTSVEHYTLSVPPASGIRAMVSGHAANAVAWQVRLTPIGSGTAAAINGPAGGTTYFGQVILRAVQSKISVISTVADTTFNVFTSGWIDQRK